MCPLHIKVKIKWSRYRPGVAQRVGRVIAVLFHNRGTRRGWVVSSTPRPHFTPGKDPAPILQEAGWAPGPVWTGGKSRPHRDSIPNRPARSQSLYRLSYRAHLSTAHSIVKWPAHQKYVHRMSHMTWHNCQQCRRKVLPAHATKAHTEGRGTASPTLDLGKSEGGLSRSCPGRFVPGK